MTQLNLEKVVKSRRVVAAERNCATAQNCLSFAKICANFETLLIPGLEHCAEEVFSYMKLDDLMNCSLVLKRYNDACPSSSLRA